ncbi:hypothetical protein LZ554_007505 [Drepanopeziza brunnea f. sp. 'monogermtubi']|nr:hypothetical protein LZ554_007505 [Drepanopeziza brunnea f. sp. 'monogermtubi']
MRISRDLRRFAALILVGSQLALSGISSKSYPNDHTTSMAINNHSTNERSLPTLNTSSLERLRFVGIKGRSIEDIRQSKHLGVKRWVWLGDAVRCSLSSAGNSCWAGFPQPDTRDLRARSDQSEAKSPFGVDLACGLLSGYRVNNCFDDVGKRRGTSSSTSSASTSSPEPTHGTSTTKYAKGRKTRGRERASSMRTSTGQATATSSPTPRSTAEATALQKRSWIKNFFKEINCMVTDNRTPRCLKTTKKEDSKQHRKPKQPEITKPHESPSPTAPASTSTPTPTTKDPATTTGLQHLLSTATTNTSNAPPPQSTTIPTPIPIPSPSPSPSPPGSAAATDQQLPQSSRLQKRDWIKNLFTKMNCMVTTNRVSPCLKKPKQPAAPAPAASVPPSTEDHSTVTGFQQFQPAATTKPKPKPKAKQNAEADAKAKEKAKASKPTATSATAAVVGTPAPTAAAPI